MKKLVFVLALGVFAACGGGSGSASGSDTTAKDSTSNMTAPAAPAVDSVAMKAKADSAMKADSMAKKMMADSMAKAAKGKKKK
jgi:hypothetical protein